MEKPLRSKSCKTKMFSTCGDSSSSSFRAAVTLIPFVLMSATSKRSCSWAARRIAWKPSFSMKRILPKRFFGPLVGKDKIGAACTGPKLGALAEILAHLEGAKRSFNPSMRLDEVAAGIPDDVPVRTIVFLHVID